MTTKVLFGLIIRGAHIAALELPLLGGLDHASDETRSEMKAGDVWLKSSEALTAYPSGSTDAGDAHCERGASNILDMVFHQWYDTYVGWSCGSSC